MKDPFPLVVIMGPTASSKSTLAVYLAQEFSGEVLACDSTQVYRYFDIGTAKVTPAEQLGIPHHLINIVDSHEHFTAGDYRKHALAVLDDLRSRGKIPIITAGTGLYLRALLDGLNDAPTRSEELRERLKRQAARRGHEYLHEALARLDPEAAARIAPRDTQKLIRALEVCILAGKPVTALMRSHRPRLEGFDVHKVGLLPSRPDLYARIEQRVISMLELGWLDEVRGILDRGVAPDSKPFDFIGYRQLRDHLRAGLPREQAILEIQQATRRYAKRQTTWFRREPAVHWFEGFGDFPAIQRAVAAHLRSALA
jgi:tRNA dimethylallyltransferase